MSFKLARLATAPAQQGSDQIVIQRSTYALAGQTIAVREVTLLNGVAQSNELFYLYSDHLGSTSAIQKEGSTDVEQARYLPFGGWRGDKPDNLPGSRGYTGHVMNNLGDGADDLGLIYMNARYYVPYIYRMVSADTIVPDPTNPQSWNRYSYVRNNPLRFIDPTGHDECGVAGEICNDELPSLPKTMSDWHASGAITDPNRTGSLVAPYYLEEKQVGSIYIMPIDSQQSTVSEDSFWYINGRRLAAAGIVADVIEMMLTPIPLAAQVPGYADAGITYFAGMLTGDNYIGYGGPPSGLPQDMIGVNQDFLVNLAEGVFPSTVAGALGVGGVAAELATPVPGDIILYESGAMIASQITDAITSGASALYDLKRHEGVFQNHITIGASQREGGLVLVYWP